MSTLYPFEGRWPTVDERAYLAPTASVIGDCEVGAEASIWFGAVLRGDVMPIRIGARTSIQDNAVVHATGGWAPTLVGEDCTVGHTAILHGCALGDRVLIGMGSIVMDGVRIGSDTLLGAGSLVPPRKTLPSGVLARGRPAKVVRELTGEELASLREASAVYVALIGSYRGP